MTNITNSPDWYRALTLKERAVLPKKSIEPNFNVELAEQRLKKWRDKSALKSDAIFAKWLEMQSITQDQLLYMLGESAEALKNRCDQVPDWLEMISCAFENQEAGKIRLSVKLPPTIRDENVLGFLDMISPLIKEGCKPLDIAIQKLADDYKNSLPFDPTTIKDVLLANLLPDLLMELLLLMVKECSQAREKGTLKGNTPAERYDYFISQIGQKDVALRILQEYPVLARRLTLMINHWAVCNVTVLERLCKDWENIKKTFSPEKDPGVISSDKLSSSGDMHRSGQVVTLKFTSGFKLVYKPRSLSIDLHFQQLLSWLNDNGVAAPFRILKILNCGSYGWTEFVTHESCFSEAEIERFYYRQGGHLALLYALRGEDFHSENLIASGEYPILIDLETVFCQQIVVPSDENFNPLNNSVMNVGLLPVPEYGNDENKGIDFSGLSGYSGQLTPYKLPKLEGTGTDEIRIEHKQLIYEEDIIHQPKLNGENIVVENYVETIVKGFIDTYSLLENNKEKLLAPDGLIAQFADDEVRVILRSTKEYGILLSKASDPNMNRNSIAIEWLFDNLWKQTEKSPYLLKTIASERQSLLDTLIPRFIARPKSTNLWSDDGECIENFFAESALDTVKHRLQNFGIEDLTKQLWFIRASFVTLIDDVDKFPPKTYKFTLDNQKPSYDQLIKQACKVADHLAKLAIRINSKTALIGLEVAPSDYYYISPLKLDLYNGLPGICLFLAYLGHITKQSSYTDLAKSIFVEINLQLEKKIIDTKQDKKTGFTSLGAFGGLGSIIYTFTHLSQLWQDSSLLDKAVEVANLIPNLIDKDTSFDIMSGSAGCIISLVNLHKYVASEHSQTITTIAKECGEHLIANISSTPQGKAWQNNIGKNPPLGMSHGVAGIAWALLALSDLTKENHFASTAQEALVYERSFFSSKKGNWPDVNREDDTESFRITWCYGATGIGMARLACLNYLNDDLVKQEISVAIKTVLANGFGNNHSLCHGDLGNLDFLLCASEKLANADLQSQVQNIASVILDSLDKHTWLCGTPFSVESPSLMTGIAGIGYQLLRLAEPKVVASVTSLENPKVSK
ncbi:MAG: type 2 lanthipeptide synthetase LanM family protein [Blastocatellia bacterium]